VIVELTRSPVFGLTVTLIVYAGAKWLHGRVKLFLLHPVLVSITIIIALLSLTRIPYPDYMRGGGIIAFFLGPAVVALGLPLYDHLRSLRAEALPFLLTTLFASIVGMVASTLPMVLLGGPRDVLLSLVAKSVTTPIAMSISREIGGLPSLTATMVVLTGVVGAVVGPVVMRLLGIGRGIAFGYALGTASHGIGTARALEQGELEGAASSLALCLNGIATAVLAPWVVRLIL
jgi:predicted murein hydrolase (TIGR00659 family)